MAKHHQTGQYVLVKGERDLSGKLGQLKDMTSILGEFQGLSFVRAYDAHPLPLTTENIEATLQGIQERISLRTMAGPTPPLPSVPRGPFYQASHPVPVPPPQQSERKPRHAGSPRTKQGNRPTSDGAVRRWWVDNRDP